MNNLFLFIYRDALALRAAKYGHETPVPPGLLMADCSGAAITIEDGWKSGKLNLMLAI